MVITNLYNLRLAFGYHYSDNTNPCGFILKIEDDRRSLLFDPGYGEALWITFDEPLPDDDDDFIRFSLESGYFNLYKTGNVPSVTRVIINNVFRDLFLKEVKFLKGTIVSIADDKKSFDVKTDLLGGDPVDRVSMQTYTPLSLPRGSIIEIDLTTGIIKSTVAKSDTTTTSFIAKIRPEKISSIIRELSSGNDIPTNQLIPGVVVKQTANSSDISITIDGCVNLDVELVGGPGTLTPGTKCLVDLIAGTVMFHSNSTPAVKSEVLSEKSERPLTTGTLAHVGKPLTEHLPKDAIHLATFTAIARDDLRPGQHVGLRNGKVSSTYTPKIGITDPFCTHSTPTGNLVMVMLYPNVISEVRHTWDHPKIDKELGA
mgnify:CR=1 FL=1